MPRKTTPTLTQALDEFLEIRETYVAKATLINDRSLLRRFVREIGATRQVHTLDRRTLELWFAKEAARQKGSSYNKVRMRAGNLLQFCHRRGWLPEDPMTEVRPKKILKRERLRLSPAELLELPEYATDPRDKAFIITAINTAMRSGEITSLRIRDLDLTNGSLRVRIHKSQQEDVLPITAELDAGLREWLTAYTQEVGPLDPDWFLFPARKPPVTRSIKGERVTTPGGLKTASEVCHGSVIVQRVLRAAGHVLEPGEGVHTLRRSVARCFFDNVSAAGHDAALRMTSSLLHHSSVTTTEVYLGLRSEKLSRDQVLRGKSFLPSMLTQEPLRIAQ